MPQKRSASVSVSNRGSAADDKRAFWTGSIPTYDRNLNHYLVLRTIPLHKLTSDILLYIDSEYLWIFFTTDFLFLSLHALISALINDGEQHYLLPVLFPTDAAFL